MISIDHQQERQVHLQVDLYQIKYVSSKGLHVPHPQELQKGYLKPLFAQQDPTLQLVRPVTKVLVNGQVLK